MSAPDPQAVDRPRGTATPPPPADDVTAPRDDTCDVLHGVPVPDPYRWLEDAADPRTSAWSQAQEDGFAAAVTTWPLREHFAGRLRELLGAGVQGVPVWRGGRSFSVRREGGQEHGVLLVREPGDAPDAPGRVLVDPMAVDPTGLTTLDGWRPSRDGRLLAYQLSHGGTEESLLRVMDVATGEVVDGPVDRTRYSPVSWLPDDSGYYYVRRLAPELLPEDERQYHRRVYLHLLGTDHDADVEVFGAGRDPRSYYGVGVSLDGRWLGVSVATGTEPRNDLYLADLHAPGSSPARPALVPVVEGLDARTDAHVGRDGRLYVWTDLDAPRGRLAVTDPTTPGPAHWRDLVPEDPEAVLDDYAVLDGPGLDRPLLVVGRTRHAVSELAVHDLADGTRLPGAAGVVDLPGPGSVGALVGRLEGGNELWFSYTDHTSPTTVHRFDASTGEVTVWSRPPGQVQVPDVQTRQVVYHGADGTEVRMFVTARRDALLPAPTVLYGYGGFGVSLTPGYSASTLAWVEAGGVYAVANLRGGSEEGEQWHRDGMLGAKQNVFDDFHAAAEHLVATGVTTPAQLSISGGSNGGLLVGAALAQRPDLYAAVVCSAPLLDMVRYEKFGLGATWNVEYGSADVAEEFAWLHAYSPYHAVRPGTAYPATLFTVYDSDTRVDPLHARKMCAALQHAVTHDADGAPRPAPVGGPVLLRCEKDVGHAARSLSRSIGSAADSLAFAAHHTGLLPPA